MNSARLESGKALTFLDDRLPGATSNGVERGNRRYRKMQKTINRVRTYAQIVARMTLGLFRDAMMGLRSASCPSCTLPDPYLDCVCVFATVVILS